MLQNSPYVLTVSTKDAHGLVTRVSGFLTEQGAFISKAHHHNDPYSGMAFLRFAFQDKNGHLPKLAELEKAFRPIAADLEADAKFHDVSRPLPVVIAVSKFGHCLFDLIHRAKAGTLNIDIKAVISNHDTMRSFVEWAGIPYHHLPITKETKPQQEAQIKEILASVDSELLILARYMQILSEDMCAHLEGAAINIHHSFLPSFKGARPYRQAFERGVKVIGATSHYVTTDLDEGPIIEQAVERIDHSAGEAELVDIGRDMECIALSRAVRWHAEQRVLLNGHRTIIFN